MSVTGILHKKIWKDRDDLNTPKADRHTEILLLQTPLVDHVATWLHTSSTLHVTV